jgi:hypothetical protein
MSDMTAEVAVLNSNGVALAADSAVTIGHAEGKIYTSADKLFQLSECAPVSIMVYGSASFLGVPWETIIKCYRTTMKEKAFPKLVDYSKHFISFLKTSKMFPATKQKDDVRSILLGFFLYLRDRFEKAIKEKYENEPGIRLSRSDIEEMFTALIQKELDETKNHRKLDGISSQITEAIRRKYIKDIAAVQREVFDKLPISKVNERLISVMATHLLTCERLHKRGQVSGIVVSGFGEKEHFPSLIETLVFGMAAGHLLRLKTYEKSITNGGQAIVKPLAQREMVHTFMEGIDPEFKDTVEKSTKELFDRMIDIILQEVKGKYTAYGKALQGV